MLGKVGRQKEDWEWRRRGGGGKVEGRWKGGEEYRRGKEEARVRGEWGVY